MSGPVWDTGQPFYWLLQQSRLPIIAPMEENNKKPQRDIYTCFYKHCDSRYWYTFYFLFIQNHAHTYMEARYWHLVSSLIALHLIHQGSLSLPPPTSLLILQA